MYSVGEIKESDNNSILIVLKINKEKLPYHIQLPFLHKQFMKHLQSTD